MYQVKNLTIRHRRDDRVLVQDLSLVLHPGDKIAVIGEEGNGKSSLLSCLADLDVRPSWLDVSLASATRGLLVSYLPQILPAADRELTVSRYVLKSGRVDQSDWKLWYETAGRFLDDPDLLYSEREMRTLSGGERLRVELCRLVLERADVMMLDEPSNDLDLPMLGVLEDFLQSRPEPLLFVSHDETLVRRTANGILHLEHVHHKKEARWTFAKVPYDQYVEERDLSYSRQLQQSNKEEAEYRVKRERYLQIESRVAHEQASISRGDPAGGRLLKKKMHAVKSLGRRMDKEYENRTRRPVQETAILAFFPDEIRQPAGKMVLSLQLSRLEAGSGEDVKVLAQEISLSVRGGEKIIIVGANGSGKTTLLREIGRLLSERDDITLGLMPQDYGEQLPDEVLPVEFLAPSGLLEDRQRALDLLGSMKFTADEMQHAVGDLSGGQKAKLFIAKMILRRSDVLILDEPTRNFSPLSAPVVREVFAEYGGTVIAVSHDRAFIREVADTVYVLQPGGLARAELSEVIGEDDAM